MTDAPTRGDATDAAPQAGDAHPAGSAQGGAPRAPVAAMALRVALSWTALLWERLWRELWPAAALAALFFALAASGVLPLLGGWAHSALLALFAVGVTLLLVRGGRRVATPQSGDARRRLERVNDLGDRPLEALADRPSDPSPSAQALWAEHRRRAARRLAGLRVGAPSPRIAGRDPRGLRLLAFVLLAAALLASGGRSGERIAAAFVPSFSDPAAVLQVAVDAWIAPPDYTGLAPIFLDRSGVRDQRAAAVDAASAEPAGAAAAAPEAIAAPVGSRLSIQVANPSAEPVLIGPDGAALPFEPFGAEARRLETEIVSDGAYRLEIEGRAAAEWRIAATPDRPPTIRVPEAPFTTPQLSLRITYEAADDYGVESVQARFTRIDGPAEDGAAIEVDLPAPGPARNGEALSSFRDFTAHPWAGGEVLMVLRAADAIGQSAESEPVALTLPQRVFQHPVAQAIVDFRRQLAWDPLANREAVRDGLDALASTPEQYGSDTAVFLSLNAAVRRLDLDNRGREPSDETVAALLQQLWETALYLEDGGASLALERLRAAERALQEALDRDADMAELERLMDELQQAMSEYMEAMADQLREMQERGEQPPMISPDQAQTVRPQDLNQMMDQIREMMRNGMRDAAQQMLSQLQQMMENMRAGVMPQMSPDARQAMDMLQDLQDVMRGQQELLDRTFDQAQQGRSGERGEGMQNLPGQTPPGGEGRSGQSPNGSSASSPEAALQEALRRQLGEVMRQFGEMMGDIPSPFGAAEGEMRQSTDALRRGAPGDAVDPQGRALDQLQSAAEAAREAMMERFSQQPGMGQQMMGEGGMESMDPLGRRPSDTYRGAADGQVEVPSGMEMQRSREIRDELRRRAGERGRPDLELDYIDRLLDQFQ